MWLNHGCISWSSFLLFSEGRPAKEGAREGRRQIGLEMFEGPEIEVGRYDLSACHVAVLGDCFRGEVRCHRPLRCPEQMGVHINRSWGLCHLKLLKNMTMVPSGRFPRTTLREPTSINANPLAPNGFHAKSETVGPIRAVRSESRHSEQVDQTRPVWDCQDRLPPQPDPHGTTTWPDRHI